MKPLFLQTGNPENGPASFTRFVLPFAYHRRFDSSLKPKRGPNNQKLFYEIIAQEDLPEARERHLYFSAEIEDVLFSRSLWARLTVEGTPRQGGSPGRGGTGDRQSRFDWSFTPTFQDGRKLKVKMSPPQLILFEAAVNSKGDDLEDPLQIGLLIVELYFAQGRSEEVGPTLENLLELNEGYRFWDRPYDKHLEHLRSLLGNCPPSILERSENKAGPTENDRTAAAADANEVDRLYPKRWIDLLTLPVRDDSGGYFSVAAVQEEGADSAPQPPKDTARYSMFRKYPAAFFYADNRAFVWTCAILDEDAHAGGGAHRLRSTFREVLDVPGSYGHWVKLLNVDRPVGLDPDKPAPEKSTDRLVVITRRNRSATDFERCWANERTYRRWEHFGCWYGFNYHAGALLAPPTRDPDVWRHFRGIYGDMALLIFYLRLALFRFSLDLSSISLPAARSNGAVDDTWRPKFERLRWRFTLFTNLYRYPLISNQQQGIEMYEMVRRGMDVEDLFCEVQREIETSHDYLLQTDSHRQTTLATVLAMLATAVLPLGLALSLLSSDYLVDSNGGLHLGDGHWILLVLSSAFLLVSAFAFWNICFRALQWRKAAAFFKNGKVLLVEIILIVLWFLYVSGLLPTNWKFRFLTRLLARLRG